MITKHITLDNQVSNVYCFDELDSTNKYLKEYYRGFNHLDVVTTARQTAGYGRRGRTWIDSDGLFFTVLVKDLDINLLPSLVHISAASVFRSLEELGLKAQIKYPNDVLVNDRKLCGILVETSISDKLEYALLGIGVNINHVDFEKAISLSDLGVKIETFDLLTMIVKNINYFINQLKNNRKDFLDICNEYSYLKDKHISYKDKQYRFIEVLENGLLTLEDQEGNRIDISDSEITLENIYKY